MDFRYLLDKDLATALFALPEDFNVLAMALESTNSGVVITNFQLPDNPVIFCNRAFENMTGYKREEIIGRNCRILQGDDRDQHSLKLLRKSIAEGASVTVELRNYTRNGVLFWNELSIAPVRNSDGVVTHYIGIQNDVTRKRAMEAGLVEQIESLNNRLEKQNRYIKKVEDVFLSIMQTSQECLVVLDQNLLVVKTNKNFENFFRQAGADVVGLPFKDIQNGQLNNPELHSLLLATLNESKPFNAFPLQFSEPNNQCNKATVNGKKIQLEGSIKDFVLVTIRCELTRDAVKLG